MYSQYPLITVSLIHNLYIPNYLKHLRALRDTGRRMGDALVYLKWEREDRCCLPMAAAAAFSHTKGGTAQQQTTTITPTREKEMVAKGGFFA